MEEEIDFDNISTISTECSSGTISRTNSYTLSGCESIKSIDSELKRGLYREVRLMLTDVVYHLIQL